MDELRKAAQHALTTNGGPIDAADTVDGCAYVMIRMDAFNALRAALAAAPVPAEPPQAERIVTRWAADECIPFDYRSRGKRTTTTVSLDALHLLAERALGAAAVPAPVPAAEPPKPLPHNNARIVAIAASLSSPRRWHELNDRDCDDAAEVLRAVVLRPPWAAAAPVGAAQKLTGDVLRRLFGELEPLGEDEPEEVVASWWKHYAGSVRLALARLAAASAPVGAATEPLWCTQAQAFKMMELAVALSRTAAPVGEPEPPSRARLMADEVFAELVKTEDGWGEDDIERVQSDLLPRVYDCLNLLAIAGRAAQEGAPPPALPERIESLLALLNACRFAMLATPHSNDWRHMIAAIEAVPGIDEAQEGSPPPTPTGEWIRKTDSIRLLNALVQADVLPEASIEMLRGLFPDEPGAQEGAPPPALPPLTDEQIRAEFAKLYQKDDAELTLAENNRDFGLEAIGPRHRWRAFRNGALSGERLMTVGTPSTQAGTQEGDGK